MRIWLIGSALVLGVGISACNKDEVTTPPVAEKSCEGLCGHGTKCVKDTCVIDWAQGVCIKPEDATCPEPEAPEWSECPLAAKILPPFRPVNTKKIPNFNPKRTRAQSFSGGSERVDDYELKQYIEHQLMDELESCLMLAACYHGGPLGEGEVDFTFRMLPSGKVAEVSASATGEYSKYGVAGCVRKIIYEHEFPKYDGEPKGVDYTLMLD